MLAQISQQLASISLQLSVPSIVPQVPTPTTVSPVPSIGQQVSISSTSPPPYPSFEPLLSNIRVNAFWLVALVCGLSAALLAILIQQWVRSYMQVYQRYDHPLKRARFRQFFFEGSQGMRKLVKQVPRLIHVSLFLFFLGLCDSMLSTNTTVGVTTIIPICLCGMFYLYIVTKHLKSPYKTLMSRPIFFLIQTYQQLFRDRKWRPLKKFEEYREEFVMEEKERKKRDVRAVRWLVDNTTVNGEMEPLVRAIPGTVNTEWGREVWTDVSDGRSDPDTLGPQTILSPPGGPAPLMRQSLRFPEGTAGGAICRCVRYLFETCKNHSYFETEEARHRRMRACVEAAASLVCCTYFPLDWFGEIDKLVNEIGPIEKINESPTTTSDQSFIVRWTCLSLVSAQRTILKNEQLKGHAGYSVRGLAHFRMGSEETDKRAWRNAQRIEECFEMAWGAIEELHRAFEPWALKRTKEQVEEILRNHEQQISKLEDIKVEADSMVDADWWISRYQTAIDDATYRLARHHLGVSFDEPRRSEFLITDMFNTSPTCSALISLQLILPGQQVQALARLGPKLREILDGQVADGHEEVLESLKSANQVPVSLRRPNGLMKRQLWHLQDIRDGGLGFTVELFFISLRKLLSIPSFHASNSVFYIGAFKTISSHWGEARSKESLGTQKILLNIICDLVIRNRGFFSDFPYPEPISTMLLNMAHDMLQGYAGSDEHIRRAVLEIEEFEAGSLMEMQLKDRALAALTRSQGTSQVPPAEAHFPLLQYAA
jgi:hypothetical protein